MTRFQYLFGLAFTGVMALAGGFAATLVMQPAQPVQAQEGNAPAVLKTSELQLVDGKGAIRARLYVGKKQETLLELSDEDGTKRVGLAAAKDTAVFSLMDTEEKPRFSAGYAGKAAALQIESAASKTRFAVHCLQDQVYSTMNDEKGRMRALTACMKDEGAMIALDDAQGNRQAVLKGAAESATLELRGGPHVVAASAYNEGPAVMAIQTNKVLRYRIGVTPAGAPEMIMNDSKGVWGVLAAITSDDRPVIGIGRDGVARVRAVMDSSGTPLLETLNKEGQTQWSAGKESESSESSEEKQPKPPEPPKSE